MTTIPAALATNLPSNNDDPNSQAIITFGGDIVATRLNPSAIQVDGSAISAGASGVSVDGHTISLAVDGSEIFVDGKGKTVVGSGMLSPPSTIRTGDIGAVDPTVTIVPGGVISTTAGITVVPGPSGSGETGAVPTVQILEARGTRRVGFAWWPLGVAVVGTGGLLLV